MIRKYLDGSTLDECIEAMRQGRTLDDLAGRRHVDTEYVGRMLQLPTAKPAATTDEPDLWRVPELEAQL